MPVVLVVAGAGEGDHHGAVEGQHHGAETPAPPATLVREALQLPCQVEGGEAQARERDWRVGQRREERRGEVQKKREVEAG